MRVYHMLSLAVLSLSSLALAQNDALTSALAPYPECAVSHNHEPPPY